jgi:hypothetical protein
MLANLRFEFNNSKQEPQISTLGFSYPLDLSERRLPHRLQCAVKETIASKIRTNNCKYRGEINNNRKQQGKNNNWKQAAN